MALSETIVAVTVNFKTPELVLECLDTFHEHYPAIHHIVVDNGGCRVSKWVLEDLADRGRIQLVKNHHNVYHGPALNQALALVNTPYAFLLDSDTKTEKGGFLEKMLGQFKDGKLFAVGWLRWVDGRRGIPYRSQKQAENNPHALPYIHPYACLLDVKKLRQGPRFCRTGAPALRIMRNVELQGWRVEDFNIQDYVWHKQAGTRGVFGGRWNPETKEEPSKHWSKFPI